MNTVFNTLSTRLSAYFCGIFGHHYAVTKKVTPHIKEYQCIHCKKQVTTDASGKLSQLTPERQDINNTVGDLYQRRHIRQAPGQLV